MFSEKLSECNEQLIALSYKELWKNGIEKNQKLIEGF